MLTCLGGYLSMTLTLSCPSNKSLYILRIMLYIEHMLSGIHPLLGFCSIGNDATSVLGVNIFNVVF